MRMALCVALLAGGCMGTDGDRLVVDISYDQPFDVVAVAYNTTTVVDTIAIPAKTTTFTFNQWWPDSGSGATEIAVTAYVGNNPIAVGDVANIHYDDNDARVELQLTASVAQ